MKVTATPIQNRQVVLDIHVDDERVEKAVDQAFRRLAGRVNVPGFRRGKAPRELVERVVGRQTLLREALETLVPQVYDEAVEQQGLTPVAAPRLEVTSTTPLQVKATVPLPPKVELGDYRSVRVQRRPVQLVDSEVEDAISRLRERHGEWAPVERPAARGDLVELDVKAELDGSTVLESKGALFIVDPEAAQPAEGFAQQIAGMAVGAERSFPLKFAEDYRDRKLAGKEALFTVRLKGVKEKRLPSLDDDFARSLGEYDSLEDLREQVRTELERRKRAEADQELEREVVRAVVGAASVEIPPQLVEHEAEHILERVRENLDRQGITIEQYMRLTGRTQAEYQQEALGQARELVTRSVVLDAIAEREDIGVDDAEVEAEIRELAQGARDPASAAAEMLGREDVKRRIAAMLRERKTIKYLVEMATAPEGDTPAVTPGEPEGSS